MFKTIDEALEWLYRRKKSVVGLHDFQRFLDEHGNPEKKLRVIHVAGTNGKGSTVNYISSILRTAGYTVGTFTSPHLLNHNERIRVNGIPVPDEKFLEYLNAYEKKFTEAGLSMFEIDFFAACLYYLEKKTEYCVIEVGLGGEFDATNTVDPLVSVITTIGFDHMEYLGNTIELIAKAKAGIIKPGKPVITHVRDPKALEVIKATAKRQNAPLIIVKDAKDVNAVSGYLRFTYRTYKDLTVRTEAFYQAYNASTAVETAFVLKTLGVQISRKDMYEGLLNTVWAGRFEKVSDDPEVILDGAHNEEGIRALCETIRQRGKPCTIVFAALKDKETDRMIESLLGVSDDIIITEFQFYRDKGAFEIAKDYGVTVIPDYNEAIQTALSRIDRTIIITGSLYFISLVRSYFVRPI